MIGLEAARRTTYRWRATRYEVSFRARVTVDGGSPQRVTVLSLSTSGAFVQGLEDAKVGAPVRIEIAVGPPLGLFVCRGEIVRKGRKEGAFGFGIEFATLTADSLKGLVRGLESYPGPLERAADGRVRWPFGRTPGTPGTDDVGISLHLRRSKGLPVFSAGRVLVALRESLPRFDGARPVRFEVHGCRLVPGRGVRRSVVESGLADPPSEPGASLVLVLIAQAQLATAITEWGWQLEEPPDGEMLATLEAARAFVDRVVDHLDAFELGPAFAAANESDLLAQLRKRTRELQRFAHRVEANASAARWFT